MNTKEKLIEKITSIEDPQILEEIDQWVTSIIAAASPKKYSKTELDAVREGFEQYKSGDTYNQQEANKVFDAWLKEK